MAPWDSFVVRRRLRIAKWAAIAVVVVVAAVNYPTTRARRDVEAALEGAAEIQEQISAYWRVYETPPASLGTLYQGGVLPFGQVDNLIWADGRLLRLVFTFDFQRRIGASSPPTIDLLATPAGDSIAWSCSGGSLPDHYRPKRCRTP